MMKLIFIRHGETDLNKELRLQGQRDPDLELNETGKGEIARTREALIDVPSKIYASPLTRTRETARIVMERFPTVPLIFSDDLKERDFGSLSGKLRSEVAQEILENDLEGRYDYRPFGGESIDEVILRIKHFLNELPLETDEIVFVVTHRGIIRILYDLFPNEMTGGPVLPGSVHILELNKKLAT
ncbi:MAG: hypothetical protein A2494_04180 [Candidatus Lloydbacteria bacterium RIFOXYC12_FULL_46_25]|uniref:Phosphoglycerate mutase n=1 Tax=Candidatus Lloydbacteria bacterium RIFOXYC12_FULL_46_25 TaxID=1798670 RepID=A0A1G2E3R4_9BACT|nr:MAG: hypothetical protein A2494_04180 [Candidatus Lloydbacteria bacterium RIFOXYC12_FULL_46_25]